MPGKEQRIAPDTDSHILVIFSPPPLLPPAGASMMNQRSVGESSDCSLAVPSGMTQYVPGMCYCR